jgi:transcriptional regulator with XRE-family HTH domain
MTPTSADPDETGSYIRSLREDAGLSQSQLADLLGCQQPAIARLEAGGTYVNMRTLERIADALGRRIEWQLVSREEAFTSGVPGRLRRREG